MAARRGRAPRTVLCVDDDQDTCDILTLFLGSHGYEVFTARTGGDALNLAGQLTFDLIILDSWLVGGSGAEICKIIRTFDAATPILFLSAAAYPDDFKAAFSAGANAYVAKPYDPEELLAKIEALIQAQGAKAPPRVPPGRADSSDSSVGG
jgi:DNA-binding response OmpR family regulator